MREPESSETFTTSRLGEFCSVKELQHLDRVKGDFFSVASDYTWVNPHLKLTLAWDDDPPVTFQALDPKFEKWRPSDALIPHWYNVERLGRLMAARRRPAIAPSAGPLSRPKS